MEGKNPFYNVGFWEYVYEREARRFTDFVIQKARRLRVLESKNLFAIPELEANQIQKQINVLSSELNILYGFKLFTDEMRNCYLDSSDKIYDAYHDRSLSLEIENHRLNQENIRLSIGYTASINETLFCIDFSIKVLEQLNILKNGK